MSSPEFSHRKRPWFSGHSLLAFWIPGMILVGVIVLALLVIAIPVLRNPEYLASAAADPVVFQAFLVTFLAGFCAVGILALLGTPLAYALSRSESPYKGLVETLVDIPLVLPHTVAGLMVYLLFMSRGVLGAPLGELGLVFEDAFPGIVAAMVFVSIPYYVNAVREGFGRVPVQLENVARSLGASRIRMFLSVPLPLTTRHILYGALLAWGRAIGEFAAVIMIAYFPVVISTLIYYRFNTGGIAESQAIAFLLILLCLVLFFIFRFLTRRAGVYDDRS
ncbi:MAG: ABC transporter permease [Methanoregulaceae archaeon]|nr:ABC transporter permease [Methanoregulaceae archaeon]